MEKKRKNKRGGWLFLLLGILLAVPAFAVNIDLKINPQSAAVESGSNQLYLNVNAHPDTNLWLTGIQASLGNADNKNSGFDTALFYANNVSIPSKPVNNYTWKGLNIGPQNNGNGTLSCSKFILPGPDGTPGDQGIKESKTGALTLYTLQLTAIDDQTEQAQTTVNLDPTPGNNSVSYYDPAAKKYLTASGSQTNAAVTIKPANAPQGFKGPQEALDLTSGNSLKVTWDTKDVTDDTLPVLYDIYCSDQADFSPDDASNRIAEDKGGSEFTFENPKNIQGNFLFKDTKTYYFKMRAKDSTVINKNKLQVLPGAGHKTTYTDGQGFVKSATPHDYQAPGAVTILSITPTDKKLEIKYKTPADADFAGIMVLKNISDALPPLLLTPLEYKNKGKPNQNGDLYGINDDLGNGWSVVAYENKNKDTQYTYTEGNLENGKTYYYRFYTFDLADEYQQGRNYNQGTQVSEAPGEKPEAVANLLALTGGEGEILLSWEIPNWESAKAKYGGAVVRAASDDSLKWNAITSPAEGGSLALDKAYDTIEEPLTETVALTKLADGSLLDPKLTYYFKVFAYNRIDPQFAQNKKYANGVNAAAIPGKAGGPGTISNLSIEFNPAKRTAALSWNAALTEGHVCELYKSKDPKVFSGNPLASGANLTSYNYAVPEGEEEIYFRVKIGGENKPWAPETVGVKRFKLEKSTTGINSIALPFIDLTADTLKESINAQAGKAVVEYVAGWDESTQKEYARLYSGADFKKDLGEKGNFSIVPWAGYQISVSENVPNWWVWGKVSGK